MTKQHSPTFRSPLQGLMYFACKPRPLAWADIVRPVGACGLSICILLGISAAAQSQAKLTFVKSFPESVPDYYRVVILQNGEAEYATAADDPQPEKFKLSEDIVKQAFDLADRLNHFKGDPMEIRKKIANMGKKTLTYENGAEHGSQTFNYSERPEAMELVALFERISNTQQAIIELDRLMHFDKLGLMKRLLQVEMDLDHKDLAEPVLLVPTLEDIAVNKAYMDICRERAHIILTKIQTPVNK
jgi:hypothetical protein